MQELGIGDTPPTKAKAAIPSSIPPSTAEPSSIPKTEGGGGGGGEEDGLTALEKQLAADWVPLGLHFGIPLFNEAANKLVCDKVRVQVSIGRQ